MEINVCEIDTCRYYIDDAYKLNFIQELGFKESSLGNS